MSGKTLYAVIGDPISHSLSPAMQNAALQFMGLDAEYIAVQVKPEDLLSFTRDAGRHLAGFNITIPHKSAIVPYLDVLSRQSTLADSVNTVCVEDGRLYGDTTDGYGLEAALQEVFSFPLRKSRVTFIGCGGVVRALAFHFALCGAEAVYLLNRTPEKAFSLASRLKSEFPLLQTEGAALYDRECAARFLADSSLAVQCTSLGLKDSDPLPLDLSLFPHDILIFDTIYRKTKLIREASLRRIPCANGLSMLLHQGAKSLSLWTRREVPLSVMRSALFSAFSD